MRKQAGFAIIATLLIVVAVAVLVFGTSFTAMIDRKVSANQLGGASAYYIAQSGLQHYKTLVFDSLVEFEHDSPAEDWCVNPLTGGIDDGFGNFLQEGESITRSFGGGEYTVTYDSTGSYIILTSVGTIGNSRSTVQLVTTWGGGPSGAWDNAIFATGQMPTVQAINGNVSIYGSVHIVNGQLELDTDLSIDGKAGVYNNYRGNADNPGNSDVRVPMGRVVAGDESAFMGSVDSLPDLCSKVKIEEGDLIFQGTGQLGSSDDPIYSIHLGDGVAKMKNGQLIQQTNANDPTGKSPLYLIYPEDEGVNSGYEGYDVPFPSIAADFPSSGLLVTPETCPWLFDAEGTFALPPTGTGTCSDAENSIGWNGTVLSIAGLINTGDASAHINGREAGPLYYQGQGTLQIGQCLDAEPFEGFAPGAVCAAPDSSVNVEVIGSIEPLAGGYPLTNALGIVSTGNIRIENKPGAEKEVAAIMAYSTGEIAMEFQTLVAGAVVATAFDMGSQVPKIAYHPGIREVAGSLCLPGAFDLASGCAFGEPPVGPGANKTPLSEVSYERR